MDQAVTTPKPFLQSKSAHIIGLVVKYFFLVLFALFFLFPFIVMICTSFLNNGESQMGVLFSPTHTFYADCYKEILTNSLYLGYIKNTVIVALLNVICAPLSASLCAYGFSKLEFKGRNAMFGVMLATMMIPSIVIQIPLYTVYYKIGWADTLFPLWVPALLGGGATNIFLMTQFMKGIPNDITNAAKIDGANSLIIFAVLVVPLCMPVFIYVMVMSFIGSWNDFMTPLLYINVKEKFTLSLGVYMDYGTKSTVPNLAMAAGVVMMLPCIVVFLFLQRFLIEGVTVTGLKG